MNMTTKCGILTALLICGLATLSFAAQQPMLLGMDAVTWSTDDVKPDVLLPLYEKSAATAIIVQGKVRQVDVEPSAKNQPKAYTYDFSAFDAQAFLKSKKIKICRIDRSGDFTLASSLGSSDEERWPAFEACALALAQHANSKGINIFWVSMKGFQPKGSTYWDLYVEQLGHIYKGIKAASTKNIVIAGGAGSTADSIKEFYGAGGEKLFDWLAVGGEIDTSNLAKIYSFLCENGVSYKKLFISCWRMRYDDPHKNKPDHIREFVSAGYHALTTKAGSYDPAWIAGAVYYPMNDYREPVGGMVITENTKVTPYAEYGGGLVDINGKPKEDLLEVIFSDKAAQTMTTDEARIAAMMTDATFTPDEQKEAALIMKTGGFYGTKVKLSYNAGSYPFSRCIYMSPTLSKTLTTRDLRDFYKPKDYKLIGARVWLWHEPSPEIKKSAQVMAKGIIQKIYDDIVAIKSKYTELALFDKEHVTLSDNSLYYVPGKPDPSRKIALPSINITISEPDLARPVSAVVWYRDVYPKQKLDIYHRVAAEDEELSKRAYDIIAHNLEPLIQAEVALDSYPVRIDN